MIHGYLDLFFEAQRAPPAIQAGHQGVPLHRGVGVTDSHTEASATHAPSVTSYGLLSGDD